MLGQQLLVDDRLRHVPGRVDDDELERVGEDRRRGFFLADDHFRAMRDRAAPHHGQLEFGNIDLDVILAKVARQPAPALHIGDDFGFHM